MAERLRSKDGKSETAEMLSDAAKEGAPSYSGRSGGRIAREVGTEDLLKRAEQGPDAGVTRVTKKHEVGKGDLGGHHGTDGRSS